MTSNLKWNIVVVGESGVGKTAICKRFVNNVFSKIYSPTVVTDHFTKNIEIHDYKIELRIWSVSGNECFKSFLPEYFKLAEGCILMFDMTNIVSFHRLSGWLSEFRTFNVAAPVIIVGNKSEDSTCKPENLKLEVDHEDLKVMACSAKNGENVIKVFESLIQKMWENTHLKKVANSSDDTVFFLQQELRENNSSNHEKFVKHDKSVILSKENFSILDKSGGLTTPNLLNADNTLINKKTEEINSHVHKKCNESEKSYELIDKSSIHKVPEVSFFISEKSDKFTKEEDKNSTILKKSMESKESTILNLNKSFSDNLGIQPVLFFAFIFCTALSLYLVYYNIDDLNN